MNIEHAQRSDATLRPLPHLDSTLIHLTQSILDFNVNH